MKLNSRKAVLGLIVIAAAQAACLLPATAEGRLIPPAQYGDWLASRANQTVPTVSAPLDVPTLLQESCDTNDENVIKRGEDRVSSQDFTLQLDGGNNLNLGESVGTLPDGRLIFSNPLGLIAISLGEMGKTSIEVTAEMDCDHPSLVPPIASPQNLNARGFSPRLGTPAPRAYAGFGYRK